VKTTHNYAKKIGSAQALLAAIRRHITGTVHLDGKPYTAEELADLVQGHVDSMQERSVAYDRYIHGAAYGRQLDKEIRPVLRDLRTLVVATFGSRTGMPEVFGFEPPKKRRALTPLERRLANERCAATRAAKRRARMAN
jgi:hypothetical protein